MAVEIKYVVVREGLEKMAFASKKDADAYDKMLDLAEVLGDWLQHSPVSFEDGQSDVLAMWLAENKDVLSSVLKSGRLPETEAAVSAEVAEETEEAEHSAVALEVDNVTAHPVRKRTKAA